jgi:two-component system chemotaxis sensor kinase CheA
VATLDDLKQTFFEESAEGLEAIELGLNELDAETGTDETVNAVFRGIHSIKGGAGVFGYESLVGFAHVFETVLDALRHGKLAPSMEVVGVLLKANDTLSDLVQMARANETAPEGFDAESRTALQELLTNNGAAEPEPDDGMGEFTFTPVMVGGDDEPAAARTVTLSYRPHDAQFEEEFIAAVETMRGLGDLKLEADLSGLPALDEIDPDHAYVHWTGTLETASGPAEIAAVLAMPATHGGWELNDPSAAAPDLVPDFEPAAVLPPAETGQADAAGSAPLHPEPMAAAAAPAEKRDNAASKAASATSIRVDIDKIDRLVNMVGELVISQSMLGQLFQNIPDESDGRLAQVMEDVFLHTRELKNSVMSMRAQPVRSVFQRMARLVRELSAKTGKKIHLETIGEGTEVDKTVIERLSDPLTHIIRNAVDHGVESPERRHAAGKPEEGTITLSADQRSSRIVIEISDNGAGIDPERVLKKARDKGLVAADANLSEDEINNLIFLPGFSTADAVSDISGRGVGMDVVRRNVQELGGRISLKSKFGHGMTIQLALPLTLAVMDGMIVRVGIETYVMPISCIVECVRPRGAEIKTVLGSYGVLRLRDNLVPLVHLSELFGIARSGAGDDEETTVIIIETSEGVRVGVVVDQLLGHQQVVIKSIEENYAPVAGIAGATILGDGRVAFILDAERLGDLSKIPQPGDTRSESLELAAG